jgi:hypothetical protein
MSSYIVDELVENLFASAGVERGTYNLKSRQNFSNFFDAYIEPYKLTSDQHKIRSGLREIMNLQIDQSIKLNTVPLDQLENVLILQPPKKIIEYQSKIDNKFKANVPRSSKSKQQKTIKDTDNKDEMKAEKQIKKETSTIKKNISKPAPYKFDENNNLIKVDDKKTPSNFYEIVNEFFEEFWTLEFEEEEVNWAFFAIITSTNCKDFKLNDFADKSYSLAVIKVCY